MKLKEPKPSRSSLKERFAELRNMLKKTQAQMAGDLHITQSSLSQIENGSRGVSLAVLLKVKEHYGLNANWLLNGEGMVFESRKAAASPIKGNEEHLIPLVDKKAHADYPSKINDAEFIKSFSLYRIPGFEEGKFRMFEVEGDSMEPTIFEGEIVISEFIEDTKQAVNGKIFILVSRDGIVVKRLLYYLNDSNVFILKSDNPKYKSYQIKKDEIIEIWEVKGKITSQFLNPNEENGSRLTELEERLDKMEQMLKKMASPFKDGNGKKKKKAS